ncbi:hypothetical protein BM536_006435 [Streptomyces phaeoluteigriseus]|uniref:Uncharacterized protein n=1 Tax=Streptomyces phaeoluteigriseus TaxID=114686 RepID=A0A1V6MX00_9ACTN|nr:hypothetical protein BM536_006435 [Streptomyces phaeoluteigriseus]
MAVRRGSVEPMRCTELPRWTSRAGWPSGPPPARPPAPGFPRQRSPAPPPPRGRPSARRRPTRTRCYGNQTVTIPACRLQYLHQGMNPNAGGDHNFRPWRLGLLTRTNSTC